MGWIMAGILGFSIWGLFRGHRFYLRYFFGRTFLQGIEHLIMYRGDIQDELFPWWEREELYRVRTIGSRRLNKTTFEMLWGRPGNKWRERFRALVHGLGLIDKGEK